MATYASASASFISVGDEFSSFLILNEKIRHLEKEQNLSLWKRDSRTINSAVVKGLQRDVNSKLVYYSLRYACYHGGRNFKSKSAGQRTNHSTYKSGCPFGIWLAASKDGTRLVVTKVDSNHNHEILKEHIETLPKRRKLNSDEQASVLNMLAMHANKWLIHQHIVQQTGKRITIKDIHNLGSKVHGHNDLQSINESLKESIGKPSHMSKSTKSPKKRTRSGSQPRANSPPNAGIADRIPPHVLKPLNFDDDDMQLVLSDRSAVLPLSPEVAGIAFLKLGGLDNIIQQLTGSINLGIRGQPSFAEFGLRMPSHTVLYGGTGSGKTAMGKELRTFSSTYPSMRLAFFEILFPEQISIVFASAKFFQPSVVYLDQLDSPPFRSMASTLGRELDRLGDSDLVFVISTATDVTEIDPSLMMQWRFGVALELPLPNDQARKEILLKQMPGWRGVTKVVIKTLVGRTNKWTSAAICYLCRNAAIAAMKRTNPHLMLSTGDVPIQHVQLTMNDFDTAATSIPE